MSEGEEGEGKAEEGEEGEEGERGVGRILYWPPRGRRSECRSESGVNVDEAYQLGNSS